MFHVFVTGANGLLGRATVPYLRSPGHRVIALWGSDADAAAIYTLDAEPTPGDIFDPASLARAMTGTDAVLYLATRVPPTT